MALRLHAGAPSTSYLVGNVQNSAVVPGENQAAAEEAFEAFCSANSLKNITSLFQKFCECISLRPNDYRTFYARLKERMAFSWKWKSFQSKMDKRASLKEYGAGKPCSGNKVLIVGAGPCGLRAAIECALLGAKVVVLEKRERFSRNNVLHLWPFVITDLRNLGAKKFYPKFCGGSVDHVSIRILQCILLKVALLLGVEIHYGVAFLGYLEPSSDPSNPYLGWRAQLDPHNHELSNYEFDVLIGADGRRSNIEGFQRKVFRGKLAIAITANFINRNTIAEQGVPEISGVARIYNQGFFQSLKDTAGIDLENIVYYKDATHYFVMTATKASLLAKNVLKNEFSDSESLLNGANIDRDCLANYALEAAQFATNNRLANLEFAIDLHGEPDVSVFDFTNMYAADNAARVVERRGHRLLVCLVGDSLIEPFWPLGTGCAQGFLGVFDAAWMARHWGLGQRSPLQMIAEREILYRILPSTKSESLCKNTMNFTIDPLSRYPHVDYSKCRVGNCRHLLESDNEHVDLTELVYNKRTTGNTPKRIRRDTVSEDLLVEWVNQQVGFYGLEIRSLFGCLKKSGPLMAIISRFRPELIDFVSLDLENNEEENWRLLMRIIEYQLGITLPFTLEQVVQTPENIGAESLLGLIGQLHELFRREKPGKFVAKMSMDTSPLDPNIRAKQDKLLAQPMISPTKKRHNLHNETAKRRRPSHKRRESLQHANINMGEKIKFLENAFLPVGKNSLVGNTNGNYSVAQIDQVRQELRSLGMAGLQDKFPASLIKMAVFQDKKQEMLGRLSSGRSGGEKYAALDEKLRNCEQQLRAGNMRAVHNVGDLTDDYHHFSTNISPPTTLSAKPPTVPQMTPSHQKCHFCGKQVYLAERQSVEGLFFHRVCFRCHHCQKVLQLNGDYSFDRYDPAGGKFYCLTHFKHRKHEVSLMTSPTRTFQHASMDTPPDRVQENVFTFQRYPSREDVLRSPSPMNSRKSLLDTEENDTDKRVLDDETVLTHNFGMVKNGAHNEGSTDSENEVLEELVNDDQFEEDDDVMLDAEAAVEKWRLRRLSSGIEEWLPSPKKRENTDQILPNAEDHAENFDLEFLQNAYDDDEEEEDDSSSFDTSSSDEADIPPDDHFSTPRLIPTTAHSTAFPQPESEIFTRPHSPKVKSYAVNGSVYHVQETSGGHQRITLQPTVTAIDYYQQSNQSNHAFGSVQQSSQSRNGASLTSATSDEVFLTPASFVKSVSPKPVSWNTNLMETARKLKEFRLSGSRENSVSEDVFYTPKTSFPFRNSQEESLIHEKVAEDFWPVKKRLDFGENDGWTISVSNEVPKTPLTGFRSREEIQQNVRNMTEEKRAAARERARLKSDAELGMSQSSMKFAQKSKTDTESSSSDSEKHRTSLGIMDSGGQVVEFGRKVAPQVERTRLLHRAQETQRATEETEARLVEVEGQLGEIEECMKRASTDDELEDIYQKQWFEVAGERRRVMGQLAELKLMAENLRLEDRLRICQEDLRTLMGVEDTLKGAHKQDEEQRLLDEIVQLRQQREKVGQQLAECATR